MISMSVGAVQLVIGPGKGKEVEIRKSNLDESHAGEKVRGFEYLLCFNRLLALTCSIIWDDMHVNETGR